MTDRVAILNMLSDLRESTKNQEVRLDNLDETINKINTMVRHLVGCIQSPYDFENMVNKLEIWNLATEEEIWSRDRILKEREEWAKNAKFENPLDNLDLGI